MIEDIDEWENDEIYINFTLILSFFTQAGISEPQSLRVQTGNTDIYSAATALSCQIGSEFYCF